VIETFALGSMIIDSKAPTMSDFRRWLTGSLLPAAFRQSDCRFRIRDDGTSQFQTSQIGQFDLTFGEDGVLYVTRVLWRERTKRPTLTPLCLSSALPV
jgi:hypothetical protein